MQQWVTMCLWETELCNTFTEHINNGIFCDKAMFQTNQWEELYAHFTWYSFKALIKLYNMYDALLGHIQYKGLEKVVLEQIMKLGAWS